MPNERLRSLPSLVPKPVRVLIIDDEELGTGARAAVLASLGYDAAVAHSGTEALARDDLASFDVIMVDYDMPVIDGVDTARRLRQSGIRAGLVMLTGRIAPAIEAGLFDAFVSKGQGVSTLVSAIRTTLQLQ